MTGTELEQIRETARTLRDELQRRFEGQQVTMTEWVHAGAIRVSVVWPFERGEVKPR